MRNVFISAFMFAALLLTSLPLCAQAQTINFQANAGPDLGISYPAASGLSSTDIRVVVAQFVRVALGLLGIVSVVIVAYAGFTWMTAGGNDEKITEAKKWLTAGVIGMAIIFSAFSIATYVEISLVNVSASGGNNVRVGP